MSQLLFIIVLTTGNSEIIKCVICYYHHHLKNILNDDLFKECVSPVIFINLKYML